MKYTVLPSQVTLTLTLVVANMLNYMDRNSVSAVLDDVKDYFHVNDTQAGLVRYVDG